MIYHGLINDQHAAYINHTDDATAFGVLMHVAARAGAQADDTVELRILIWHDTSWHHLYTRKEDINAE